MFDLQEVNEEKLPTDKENKVLDRIEDEYNDLTVGANKKKPNGLFLARISWNETTELIWRIYEHEKVHDRLSDVL
jgi:hypothetical protein